MTGYFKLVLNQKKAAKTVLKAVKEAEVMDMPYTVTKSHILLATF